jgi:peptidoglycan/LPS O-acetylase OafA/YrhL
MLGALFLVSQVFISDDPEAHIRRFHLWGLSGTELATAAILMHAVLPGTSMLKRFLAWRPLVGLGRISYGLYLWHYPIFAMLARRLQGHVDPTQPLQFGIAIGAAIILTLLVAMISYRFVERPALRLKARFAGRPLPAQSL